MKAILLIVLLSPWQLWAQFESKPTLPLALSYVADELPSQLAESDKTRIKSSLIRLCKDHHLIASKGEQNFSVHPRLDVLESYDGEGMRNLRFVKIEFGLSIRETATGINLGAYSWTLIGSGANESRAMMAALRKVPKEDGQFEKFLSGIRPKLNQYYAANCQAIIAKADRYVTTGEYDLAIAELVKVPTEAEDCSEQAGKKLQSAYDEYQRIHCGPLLQQARAAAANRQFSKALDLLLLISPTSACAEDANAMITQIGQSKAQLHQQKYAFAKEMHQQQLAATVADRNLSIQRWIGITEIAKTVGGIADIFNPSIDFNIKLKP